MIATIKDPTTIKTMVQMIVSSRLAFLAGSAMKFLNYHSMQRGDRVALTFFWDAHRAFNGGDFEHHLIQGDQDRGSNLVIHA